MKKFLSFIMAFIIICAAFTGCTDSTETYSYNLNQYDISLLNGSPIDNAEVESAQLVFDAQNKKITFECDGNSYTGELTNGTAQDGNDLWTVVWEKDPEGNETYTYNYSAFICGQDYDNPSPYVMLIMHFDGERNSVKAFFSLKYEEVGGEAVAA